MQKYAVWSPLPKDGSDEPSWSRRDLVIVTGASGMPQSVTTVAAGHATTVIRTVHLVVNGRTVAAEIEPRVTLLDFLRDRLGLTGTKKGCNEGACGTCTVLVDGKLMN